MKAKSREARAPDLVADARLYPTEEGGRKEPISCGFRCPVFVSKDTSVGGWDTEMQLSDVPFEPGTGRRIGFLFLTQEGLNTIREAGRFYLWDGRFIGEAIVVADA